MTYSIKQDEKGMWLVVEPRMMIPGSFSSLDSQITHEMKKERWDAYEKEQAELSKIPPIKAEGEWKKREGLVRDVDFKIIEKSHPLSEYVAGNKVAIPIEEERQEDQQEVPPVYKVNRVEVIDDNGRSYVNWNDKNRVSYDLQDDGRTLKIFITRK